MKTLLLTLALTGIWVTPAGDPIEVDCPNLGDYESGRVRLPRGCTAHRQGVLLSVDRYKRLEVDLAESQAMVAGQRETIDQLLQQKKDLQAQLLRLSVTPTCTECPSTLPATLNGALYGSLVTFGGCLLWTTSR